MTQRDLRQQEIVPPEALARVQATVIGVGAIGRQVALQLAAVGPAALQLVDYDIVETVNLASQGYRERDLGESKAEATARLAAELNANVIIDPVIGRFRRSQTIGEVVFCCVDAIQTRKQIWEAVRDRVSLFVDGRMSAEAIRVLTAAPPAHVEHYPTTLFGAGEAYRDGCTARSTIFTANVAAGLMIEQFTRWLRKLPIDADLQLNLLTSELTVVDHPA